MKLVLDIVTVTAVWAGAFFFLAGTVHRVKSSVVDGDGRISFTKRPRP